MYRYYYKLFLKIKSMTSHLILKERIRIPNFRKLIIMIKSISRHQKRNNLKRFFNISIFVLFGNLFCFGQSDLSDN